MLLGAPVLPATAPVLPALALGVGATLPLAPLPEPAGVADASVALGSSMAALEHAAKTKAPAASHAVRKPKQGRFTVERTRIIDLEG